MHFQGSDVEQFTEADPPQADGLVPLFCCLNFGYKCTM